MATDTEGETVDHPGDPDGCGAFGVADGCARRRRAGWEEAPGSHAAKQCVGRADS